jgi:hypothetical protein
MRLKRKLFDVGRCYDGGDIIEKAYHGAGSYAKGSLKDRSLIHGTHTWCRK